MLIEEIALVIAVRCQRAGVAERPQQQRDIDRGKRRHRDCGALQPVPILMIGARGFSQMLEIESEGEGAEEHLLQRAVVQQLIDERSPAVVKGNRCGNVILNVDERWQPCFQGVVGEDALSERVERLDGCGVDLGQGGLAALLLLGREAAAVSRGSLQRCAHAVPEFDGGGVREGDRGNVP